MFKSEYEPILAELIEVELEIFSPVLAAEFRALVGDLASDGHHPEESVAAHDARIASMPTLQEFFADGTLSDIATLKGIATELSTLNDMQVIRQRIQDHGRHIHQTRFVGRLAHA